MKEKNITAVNFHLTKACNMKCRYCFAGFNKVNQKLIVSQQKQIIRGLFDFGFTKINFVGGEPFLLPQLAELIKYSKSLGFYTSIVTNGSLLTEQFIIDANEYLDMIGISIDSLNPKTNSNIGRKFKRTIPDKEFYFEKCMLIKDNGITLKINTVVSKLNLNEDFSDFIRKIKPERWKLFQVLEIEGENNIEYFKISKSEFINFVDYHTSVKKILIAEDNDIMKGSYVMVDPEGKFFDNIKGKYALSKPILEVGIEQALNDINFDYTKFLKRNGDYYNNLVTKNKVA